jgi:hypothetical protein
MEDVVKDLQEMKVNMWRQKAVDREERESKLRRPTALTGLQSQTAKEQAS